MQQKNGKKAGQNNHQPSIRKGRAKPNQRRTSSRAKDQKSRFQLDWSRLRFQAAAGLFLLVWGVLWLRAGYVQLVLGPELQVLASRQHSYTELVEAKRGNIYDRNGQVLARSVECRSIYANPREIDDIAAATEALAPILGIKPATLQKQLEQNRSFIWLARKVDDATAADVRNASIKGVGLSREYERVYPFKHLAGQLLGFVGLDNEGLEGLERSFNEQLAGLAQKNVVQRDGVGRNFYDETELNTHGKDLHLTLDVQIQFIAEDVIAEAVEDSRARWGGVMVADAVTGDVLAWAQYPFFNPNNFRNSTPAQYRNNLAADALEPGSTLKPFLMAAALEEKVITKDTVFFCENGSWKTKKITIRDDGRSYGEIKAEKILPYSSNIGVAKIALQLGTPAYHSYLTRLGFGQRTGIGVGESRGIVRQPQDWNEVDLMSAAFGQSVSVTGVQMTQAFLTLANGGQFLPIRLVMDEEGHASSGADQRIFSQKTAKAVMAMLEDTVDGDGTGKRARIPGLRVAGKTGTAQKATKGHKTGYGDKRTASFAGIVPADKPRYVILVFLDEPTTTSYGSVLAAPAFQKVASRTLAYGGYLPDVVFATADDNQLPSNAPRKREKVQSVKAGTVPDVAGMSLRRAMERFAEAGVVPEVLGEGLTIVRQDPAPGQPCVINSTPVPCTVWMSEESVKESMAQEKVELEKAAMEKASADKANTEAKSKQEVAVEKKEKAKPQKPSKEASRA